MNIKSSLIKNQPQRVAISQTSDKPAAEEAKGGVEDSFVPSAPEGSSFGPRVLGGFIGAVVGGVAGSTGVGGAVAASGLGAGVATVAGLGPGFVDTVKSGMNGDPVNDIALTSSAIFAGGVVLSSASAAAGVTAFALEQALPGSGRVIGMAMGALAGASLGIWN